MTVDRRVTFENTTARPDQDSHEPSRQQARQTPNEQRPQPLPTPLYHRQRTDEVWGEGGSQNRQWPNAAASEIGRQKRGRSTLLYSNDMYRTSSGNNRDIGQIVRRWGYKFAGEPGESIDTFLERVEESWELAKLTEVEVLSALPELFIGVAATWVRSNRSTWST